MLPLVVVVILGAVPVRVELPFKAVGVLRLQALALGKLLKDYLADVLLDLSLVQQVLDGNAGCVLLRDVARLSLDDVRTGRSGGRALEVLVFGQGLSRPNGIE